MSNASLLDVCFESISKEIDLNRVEGLDDIENVKLQSGEDGGGIKVYTGDRDCKVTMVDFKLGDGIPVPHHDNRLCVGAQIFQITPDFSYKVPGWGINSIEMKDGHCYFDTDFSFGFDLIHEYEYVKKYIYPFEETYQSLTKNPDFTMVTNYESTPWVRTYISPLFFSAITKSDKLGSLYDLARALIEVWLKMYREAEKGDDALRQSQQARLKAKNAGAKDSDRMGKVLFGAYGQETFMKFFKAMS